MLRGQHEKVHSAAMASRSFLVVCLTVFAFPATVESPPWNCSPREYFSERQGFCCRKCPAGKYRIDDCYSRHQHSVCESCTIGKGYTAHENDFDVCLLCSECRPGFKMVSPCTLTSDTVCQCQDGSFLPPGYVECVKCRTKCPAEQVIAQNCSATTNAKCGPLPTAIRCPTPQKITNGKFNAQESDIFTSGMFVEYSCESGYKLIGNNRIFCTKSGSWNSSEPSCIEATDTATGTIILSIVGILAFILLLLACFCWRTAVKWLCGGKKQFCKRDEETDAKDYLIAGISRNQMGQLGAISQSGFPQNADASNLGASNTNMESSAASDMQLQPQVQQHKKPPQIRIKNKTQELDDIYLGVRKLVVSHNWNMLMRKSGLTDIDIERINQDYLNDSEEQRYRMLTALRNRFGVEKALFNLLDGLWNENLYGIHENLINELISKDIITLENNDSNTEA